MAFKSKSYINIKMLLRVIGWLLMVEAAMMLVPLLVGLRSPSSSRSEPPLWPVPA